MDDLKLLEASGGFAKKNKIKHKPVLESFLLS